MISGDRWHELRSLLVDPERERIEALERTLASPMLHVDEVARVLPDAIERRTAADPALGAALAPVVGDAIRTSVRRDPQPLVDAIFPVMGPAIRRAISSALAELVQSLNTTLDHTFSARGLAWRWEAIRTGKSFGEVVLSRSLLYRVEQIFVIHRESGLLIDHHTAPGVQAPSPEMVASMLTALRDFARDSFRTGEHESLDAIALGDLTVWAESGPEAVLAAVIRGQPPLAFRQELQSVVEELHAVHALDIERFAESGVAFPVRHALIERCLVSRLHPAAERRGGTWRTWLLALVVLGAVGWCTVPRVLSQRRFDAAVGALRTEPGIVVGSTGRDGGRFVVTGLRDPMARDPATLLAAAGVATGEIDARWEPYVALRPEFMTRRAALLLAPPSTVTLSVRADTLVAEGVASAAWRREALRLGAAVAGITAVDLGAVADSAEQALRLAAGEIEQLSFDFALGSAVPRAGQEARLDTLATRLRAFRAAAGTAGYIPRVALLGSADSVGTEATNAVLRNARAARVRALLAARGVDPGVMTAVADTSGSARNVRQVRLLVTADPAGSPPR